MGWQGVVALSGVPRDDQFQVAAQAFQGGESDD